MTALHTYSYIVLDNTIDYYNNNSTGVEAGGEEGFF